MPENLGKAFETHGHTNFTCPRNKRLTKNAKVIIDRAPKMNIRTKSADFPRKLPSSSILQYLYVKIMLNRKLKPNVPKKRKVVTILQSWNCLMIRRGLKYSWKGDTISSWTARVVMTQAVVYTLVTGGISR